MLRRKMLIVASGAPVALAAVDIHPDDITGLERGLAPAGNDQAPDRSRLEKPVCSVAILRVGDRQNDVDVRVLELEHLNRTLDGDFLRRIEGGIRVMCAGGVRACEREANDDEGSDIPNSLHVDLRTFTSAT